jgi:hypothetical protein
MVCTGEKGRALEMQAPPNQSLQRTWLSPRVVSAAFAFVVSEV